MKDPEPNNFDILDHAYNTPSIIKDLAKLQATYLPANLKFRKQELQALSMNFRNLLSGEGPGVNMIITGDTGVGKTALIQSFCNWALDRFGNEETELILVKLDCRILRNSFMVFEQIALQIMPEEELIREGYRSIEELYLVIINYISSRHLRLIIALDNIAYVIPKGGIDLLYSLSHPLAIHPDKQQNFANNLGLILIDKSSHFLRFLDDSTASRISGTEIHLPQLSKSQLKEILQDRIEEALEPDTVSEDSLDLIVQHAIEHQANIRMLINILRASAQLADQKGYSEITPEVVEQAFSNMG